MTVENKSVTAQYGSGEIKPSQQKSLEPFLFFREGIFYIVEIPRDQVVANVELNPGTIRVEDVAGNVVWSLQ